MTIRSEYVTRQEAADIAGVCGQTIWRWIRARKLPSEKFGREVAIKRIDLALLIDRRFDRRLHVQLTKT